MIKQKWEKLNQREQKLIMLAMMFILIYLILSLFTKKPIKNSNTKDFGIYSLLHPSVSTTFANSKKQFVELLPKINKIKQLQKQVKNYQNIPDNNLLKFIKNSIIKTENTSNDSLIIEEQDGSKNVIVKYNLVAFDSIIEWLEKTNRQYGIIIKKANIEQLPDKPGFVNVELLITVQN